MSQIKTILDNEDFKVTLELEGEDILFVHCDVFTWTPSVLRKLRLGFSELREMAHSQGYDALYTFTQNKRWCDLLDNSYELIDNINVLGQEFEVLKWENQ